MITGKWSSFTNEDLEALLDTTHRHYLPGYGQTFLYVHVEISHRSQLISGWSNNGSEEWLFILRRTIINNDPDSEYIPEKIIQPVL